MWNRDFSPTIVFFLLLQAVHVPVPWPDLDGECRGTPITSLADANAWHVLVLGVRPCDDIDRGPFREDEHGKKPVPSDSPFGDLGLIVSAVTIDCAGGQDSLPKYPFLCWLSQSQLASSTAERTAFAGKHLALPPPAQTRQALTCVLVI